MKQGWILISLGLGPSQRRNAPNIGVRGSYALNRKETTPFVLHEEFTHKEIMPKVFPCPKRRKVLI